MRDKWAFRDSFDELVHAFLFIPVKIKIVINPDLWINLRGIKFGLLPLKKRRKIS